MNGVFSPAGFLLELYFQMVHDRIGKHETPSLHTAMLSGNVSVVGRV